MTGYLNFVFPDGNNSMFEITINSGKVLERHQNTKTQNITKDN